MDVKVLENRLLTREQMAKRIAEELQDSWVVNIGIGMPTLVPGYVPKDRDVIFHSENGIVGMGGPPKDRKDVDPDLLSAGKQPMTLITGGAYVHHADSFAIVRGGRLDAGVLGAFQVAENGDLANWKVPGARGGNVGGAMDIAAGARRIFAMMTHVTKEGEPKIVTSLTYPLTAQRSVTKIFTDMAVIAVTERGLVLEEAAAGISPEDVQAATGARLTVSDRFKPIAV